MATKRITMGGYAVIAPARFGLTMRNGFVVQGVGTSPPTAWKDAAEGNFQKLDGQELARRNPGWMTVDCKITVVLETPAPGPFCLGGNLQKREEERG